jgi:PAS domain S-box-containing protein
MGAEHDDEDGSLGFRSDIEMMLDAITDYGIIRLDAAGKVSHWGVGAQTLLGYAPAEVIGRPTSLFYTDEDRAAEVAATELDTARASGRHELEGWRVRKDGSRFRAKVVITAIRDNAEVVVGYAKVMRDVDSEQRRAATTYQHLVESAPDAMVVIGPDGRITIANAQADQLFGYTRNKLIGRDIEILLPPRFRTDHVGLRSSFFAAPSVRRMGADLNLVAVDSGGVEFPVEVSLSPLHIEGQVYVSAAIRDVTERRDYERRLRRQHEEILELSTPVIQVWDKVLTLPIVGTLDSFRASRLTDNLLMRIGEIRAKVVIFDLSGVPTMDTKVAQHLLQTVQAAALMGAISIVCGMRPETVQSTVNLGINIEQLRARSTLKGALQLALEIIGETIDGGRHR